MRLSDRTPAQCSKLLFITAVCRTVKAVRGRRVKRGDVCYGMLRAAACVDESDHHTLMDVWHGQTVREDRVGEYVKFTYKIL